MGDRQAEVDALRGFLRAEPDEWPQLAPRVVEDVGIDRLRRIVESVRERVGGFHEVTDSREGLTIGGPGGRALAWVRTDGEGRITGLLISPARKASWEIPLGVRSWAGRALCVLLLGYWIEGCWSAVEVTGWVGAVLVLAAGYVLYEGYCNAAAEPWWIRRPIEAGAVVGLGSAWRVPGLPLGDDLAQLAIGAALLVGSAVALVRSRRHRWGTTTAAPLARFPLRGTWYVGQGGGRGLNHHVTVLEQRGAVDLIQVGPGGSRRGGPQVLESYLAYGATVYAPCDGQVAVAVDGLPDQTPGVVRYAPVYGNHVLIDTGHETVLLAHLRPGSVRVAAGESVRAGQPLGEVGNSGNSTEPHLHFHAERDGEGLDLLFAGLPGTLYRGRTVRG